LGEVERERNGPACMRRHQPSALPPVGRFRRLRGVGRACGRWRGASRVNEDRVGTCDAETSRRGEAPNRGGFLGSVAAVAGAPAARARRAGGGGAVVAARAQLRSTAVTVDDAAVAVRIERRRVCCAARGRLHQEEGGEEEEAH